MPAGPRDAAVPAAAVTASAVPASARPASRSAVAAGAVRNRERRVDLAAMRQELGAELLAVLTAFERFLRLERNRSAHTAQAYLGDITSLLHYLRSAGETDLRALDLRLLQGWLASLHQTGASRTTLARRAAAARTFSTWAFKNQLLAADVAELLVSHRRHRWIPAVLSVGEAGQVVDSLDGDEPEQLLDRLVL